MLQTNMNDNKKEIRERKHSSFDSIVCWYPSYYAESGDDLLSIQTFFFHPDYDCRYRSCNGSCLYLGSRTIPPIGIFTLPWRVCGCKSNDFICYKQKKKAKKSFFSIFLQKLATLIPIQNAQKKRLKVDANLTKFLIKIALKFNYLLIF